MKKIIAVATVLAMAGMIQAATVTYSDSVSGVNVPGSISVNVQQFDNTVAGIHGNQLGAVLNKVTLSLVTATETCDFNFLNKQDATTWTVTLDNGNITFGNGSKQTVATTTFSKELPVPHGASGTDPFKTGSASSGNDFTTSLSAFEGSGNVATMTVGFAGTWDIAGLGGGSLAGPDVWTGEATWSVTYDYTPASVPEPASMALLGIGGLVVALRRRFSKKA